MAQTKTKFYTVISTSCCSLGNNDYSNFAISDPNDFPTNIDSFFTLLNNAIGNNIC